jgi:ribosomal protein L23
MRSPRQIIIRPVVTERSTTLGDEKNAFSFSRARISRL